MYYSYIEIEYVATSFSPARTDLALKLVNTRRTMNVHSNQQKKGGRDGGDDGGEVQRVGHAGEA